MPVLPTPYNLEETATNASVQALQVVCAWPVSGQYGPGSRILYYVLVAACVFARKAEWLRNACLAAALLFPAVAALHALVLAAVRVEGAVDMDIYGAFQLCSIGILAAPVTVRLSRTYFYDPGRNTIFLWTGLILAGLLSLTVSFFRLETSDCFLDNDGNSVSLDRDNFPYGTTCGLTCSPEHGPRSPLRDGSANDINVIPAPHILTFGMGTLFAASCCIPAILSLVFMWTKILENNWKKRFGVDATAQKVQEPIEGTNGATIETMTRVNRAMRIFLSAVEVPIFGAAILAILIIGERNFFSRSMRYETEPLATIGQWAPIVGASLAVIGSLYMVLAADIEAVEHEQELFSNASIHPNSSVPSVNRTQSPMSMHPRVSHDSITRNIATTDDERGPTPDVGHRRRVARKLTIIGNRLGNAAHEHFDVSGFKQGPATNFPEIPGEALRNPELGNKKRMWTPAPSEGNITPGLQRQNSRGSFVSSSGLGISLVPTISRAHSAAPVLTMDRGSDSGIVQHVERISFENPQRPLPSTDQSRGRTRVRSDTLQVPSPAHHSATVFDQPSILTSEVQIGQEVQSPPSIVLSKGFQEIQNLTPLQSSLRFLPTVICGILTNIATGFLVKNTRASYLVAGSSALSALACLLMAIVKPEWNFWACQFFAVFLSPMSSDVLYTTSNLIISSAFPAQKQSLAGGVFNTVAQIGNSVGLTLGAVIAVSVTGVGYEEVGEVEEVGRVLSGFRATFWMCFACMFLVVGIVLGRLRKAGKVGLKKE